MKMTNFILDDPTQAIILIGLGLEWDLHNYATFTGLSFEAISNTLQLEWKVPHESNPWGCIDNHARGCRIVFHRVVSVKVGPSVGCPQFGEADTLHGLSKVTPEAGQYRFKKEWSDSAPFNLLFEFGNGWAIEVDAESAELVAAT